MPHFVFRITEFGSASLLTLGAWGIILEPDLGAYIPQA